MLTTKRNEPLWVLTKRGPLEQRADVIVAAVASEEWIRLSAGDGAKGLRLYDWARVPIRPRRDPGWEHWLLVRRSLSDPEDLAYYVYFAPAGTLLDALVQVAGARWTIETCIEEAKGEVGLDQYDVRKWDGWYRHITLALFAHAILAVIRSHAAEKGGMLAST